MNTAATVSQSGLRGNRGKGNGQNGQGSRGGAPGQASAASPPRSSIMCVSDYFNTKASTARSSILTAAIRAYKKKTSLESTIKKLELALEEGSVPSTLKVKLPEAYGIQHSEPSESVLAAKHALERAMLTDAINTRQSELEEVKNLLSDPVGMFVRDYEQLVSFDDLTTGVRVDAKRIQTAQSNLLSVEWLQAKADIDAKCEQDRLSAIQKSQAQAAKEMEIERLGGQELLSDLVQREVGLAIKRQQESSSLKSGKTNDPNPNPKGTGKGRQVGNKRKGKPHAGANTSHQKKGKNQERAKPKPGSKNARR